MRNQMLATCSVETFGAALKEAEMAVVNTLGQDSDPANAEAYQTARYEAIAQAILGYLIDNAQLWAACADAIIDHIRTYGEVDSLSCQQSYVGGTSPHIHNVSTTAGQQGKIS